MKIAFVFPGQGSQSVGMMKTFAPLPRVRETFDEASAVLKQDVWKMVEEGPAEDLNQTVHTQPVMLIAGIALYRAWQAAGGKAPELSAGHSLGEYSALVASAALEFGEAVALVRFRAQAMQEAVPAGTGGMAAILGLDDEAVLATCKEASAGGETAEAANFNSPAQVVIAGTRAGVEKAMEIAKARGAKRTLLLPMSAPSHCSLMQPAAERMRQRLADAKVGVPAIPVIQNADVARADSADAIRAALVKQIHKPVRWVETVRSLAAMGATHIVECGPGKVLAGLGKRIAPDVQHLSFGDETAFNEALATLR